MIHITLQDGTLVRVDGFEFKPTYLSLIEGKPCKDINDFIIEQISYPSHWGKRKTMFKVPTQEELNTQLKPATYCTWLACNEPFNNHDGSNLVVIWMDENPGDRTIPDIIEKGVNDINWKNEAEGFDY